MTVTAEYATELGRQVDELEAENAKLRTWIKWALGEGPDPDGNAFHRRADHDGEYPAPPLEDRYWWRKYLRRALET